MSYSQEKHLLDRKGSNMNIQIFGTKKSFDTKKAQRWFKERRIKFQMVDLKEKGLSVAEVGGRVGYDSAGKFTGAFKKVMHLTPSEYRRERGRRYEG